MAHQRNKFLDEYGFTDPVGLPIRSMLNNETEDMRTMSENKKEWKKVEATIFKFEKEGDTIEGTLVSAEDSHLYNNKVYKIETKDKMINIVFGTTVLDSQMSGVGIGQDVRIVFTGIKENPKSGQNDIKLFDVFVK